MTSNACQKCCHIMIWVSQSPKGSILATLFFSTEGTKNEKWKKEALPIVGFQIWIHFWNPWLKWVKIDSQLFWVSCLFTLVRGPYVRTLLRKIDVTTYSPNFWFEGLFLTPATVANWKYAYFSLGVNDKSARAKNVIFFQRFEKKFFKFWFYSKVPLARIILNQKFEVSKCA